MSEITINDEFGYLEDYSYLNSVLNKALEVEQVNNAIFSIIFVSDEYIRNLNKKYRNIDKSTDVLSFAIEENEDISYNDSRLLGDIFISIETMKKQSIEYGHSEKRELSFLAIHGLLHLLGYDHMTNEEEKEMILKQELILDASNIKRES